MFTYFNLPPRLCNVYQDLETGKVNESYVVILRPVDAVVHLPLLPLQQVDQAPATLLHNNGITARQTKQDMILHTFI